LRRIVLSIGEGLLVIALFTAALSAQNATTHAPARLAVVAPAHLPTDGLGTSLPKWLPFNFNGALHGTEDVLLLNRLQPLDAPEGG
jgi:hypothetical protein